MDPKTVTLTESVRNKWKPIVEHKALPAIQDNYRKAVTTVLLENQEQFLRETFQGISGTNLGTFGGGALNSTGQTGSVNSIDAFDPILISLVRRAMPNLMAYDLAGVQPMTGPTGLIFAMKTRYTNRSGAEAFFGEANTAHSGATGTSAGDMGDMFANDEQNTAAGQFDAGKPMPTTTAEALGSGQYQNGVSSDAFNEMSFTIEKTAVQAKTRALKAEYTVELAQDLKAVHGLDAESELANILSTEILFEINRELVRTIYDVARLGCQQADLTGKQGSNGLNGAAGGGVYDLELDSDGRWSAEKFRGLQFQIERECNVIGAETRRGRGNFVVCSPDVVSALSMSGILNTEPAFRPDMNTDVNGNTLAGTIAGGKVKVYIDPYSMPTSIETWSPINFICVGYKGTSPYDAGIFYCPYVPLQMVRAIDPGSFQPKIGFKTRYGMVSNPFVMNSNQVPDAMNLGRRLNHYYRIFKVTNLHGNDASYGG
jgi:hypothetical protein